jgi:diguanylate cyclase (GGDEF)-like protein
MKTMKRASAAARIVQPIDIGLLAAGARTAAAAIREDDEPAPAIDAALAAFYDAVAGVMPSVFVLEHGRQWLVAQRGYAVVPDGLTVDSGIIGRAIRLGRAQLVPDAKRDPDYVQALPGVVSELAVPLRSSRGIVGVLNVETERALPDGAAEAVHPLVRALTPLAEALRDSRTLDLAALARLFVHLGSLRDPRDIAALGAASLCKVLPVQASQVVAWDELGTPSELASWQSDRASQPLLSEDELELARTQIDASVVCQVLELPRQGRAPRSVVWLPLRANAGELGALVGVIEKTAPVDPVALDTAAVLAAHVAASLDAAISLQRERLSAVTDPLTGILNRRGLEERLERALAAAQEARVPVSLIVIDCDDFKEINDRAGHEFGDVLLREIADALGGVLPDGAVAARLGGDEFVVMLPEAGADAAETLGGQIRSLLAEGLTDAGFPLRISAGVSTYPFDGAKPSSLLRAADQALYAAKASGKDRIASFRELAGTGPVIPSTDRAGALEGARRGRGDTSGAVLSDAETTVAGICDRLNKALVFVVGATGCSTSRVLGDYVVDATEHALREVSLGDEAAYRLSDFPLTAEVLRTAEPRTVSFADGDVDPAEAFILRDLGMNALMMLPIMVRGRAWGLVELYEMRLRRFGEDDLAVAQFLVAQAQRRLELVAGADDALRRPRVYELPPGGETSPRPRTR